MRSRYDSVINSQNIERNRIKDSIESRVESVQQNIQTINSICEALSINQEVSREELNTIAKNVEDVLNTIKGMQEQAKMKEIAKQAIHDKHMRSDKSRSK